MTVASVRAFLDEKAPDVTIIELEESTATVQQAAQAHDVEPGQIAKTLSLKVPDGVVLVVTRGDARLDNKKLKQAFHGKTKMLPMDDVVALTGHPVGGVCPFDLPDDLPVYCDVSLKAFDLVMPAAGSTNSAVAIAPQRLAEITHAEWVDVCKDPA